MTWHEDFAQCSQCGARYLQHQGVWSRSLCWCCRNPAVCKRGVVIAEECFDPRIYLPLSEDQRAAIKRHFPDRTEAPVAVGHFYVTPDDAATTPPTPSLPHRDTPLLQSMINCSEAEESCDSEK